jgi:hypothetical protein
MGVLGRNIITRGDRVSIAGAIGVGWADGFGYSKDGEVGARVGLQWTWK